MFLNPQNISAENELDELQPSPFTSRKKNRLVNYEGSSDGEDKLTPPGPPSHKFKRGQKVYLEVDNGRRRVLGVVVAVKPSGDPNGASYSVRAEGSLRMNIPESDLYSAVDAPQCPAESLAAALAHAASERETKRSAAPSATAIFTVSESDTWVSPTEARGGLLGISQHAEEQRKIWAAEEAERKKAAAAAREHREKREIDRRSRSRSRERSREEGRPRGERGRDPDRSRDHERGAGRLGRR